MLIKIKNEEIHNIQRDYGVYLIKCIVNNNLYIGSTNQSFRARFSNHCKFLKNNNHGNKKIQEDFNKFGCENFEFEILNICFSKQESIEKEQYFINLLNPTYNILKIAYNNSKTNLGKKFSEEQKEKIRQKSKLFKHSNLEKISNQNKQGSTKIKLTNVKTKEEIIVSEIEAEKFFNVNSHISGKHGKIYKGYNIDVLKTQRKSVLLLINDEWLTFNSFEKCDKFLNKWRGFTSTQYLKNAKKLCDYKVKFNCN